MSFVTLMAIGSVVAGVVLVWACAVSIAAEKPPRAAGEAASAASVRVWCPDAGALARVRMASTISGRHLTLLSCERFPAGPVECDHACVTTHLAA